MSAVPETEVFFPPPRGSLLYNLLKLNDIVDNSGRVMALDVGDKRIGLAVSDELRLTPQLLKSITRHGEFYDQIGELCRNLGVRVIVVGIPLELDGSTGNQAKKVLAFEHRLIRRFSSDPQLSSVVFARWDERHSTNEADRYLQGSTARGSERRAKRDTVAAALMLEGYLARASL